jgi:predicted naringenin-chalcone synthase
MDLACKRIERFELLDLGQGSVLHAFGNMSSATILFVLDELQRQRHPARGDYGVLMAFWPGLTMEAALVRWKKGK